MRDKCPARHVRAKCRPPLTADMVPVAWWEHLQAVLAIEREQKRLREEEREMRRREREAWRGV